MGASNMRTGPLGSTEDSASEVLTVPVVLSAQQIPLPATSFFNLPRELRDLIYSHLFEAVYTQSGRNLHLSIPPLDSGRNTAKAETSDRLAIMQASRRLWEEGSTILYGQHLFRFHVGSTSSNATFLTQRTANLMQDIEITLGPSKAPGSVRILQLFGTSQIPRKSCFIKLQFRKPELIDDNSIEALRQLTGFKVLTLEVDSPVVIRCRQSGAPIPWVSGLLAYLQVKVTPALGPSTFANGDGYRRLVFKPSDPRR